MAKLDIFALDISGNNYMTWASNARMHLRSNGLLDTIDQSKTTSDEDKAKAMVFLRHHLHYSLQKEYITNEDPVDLWQSLKNRFDHQKYVILPKAKHEWLNLRFLDYKSVADYNSAMFDITSRMKLCGEKVSDYDMIEKTLSTFHPGNVLLQEQYRAKEYKRYSELMHVLLVAEQNNELVMMNHQTRPTGSVPLPEVNTVSSSCNNWRGRGWGRGRGRFRGRGRGGGRGRGKGRGFHPNNFNAGKPNKNLQVNDVGRGIKKQDESTCYRCGMKGHWYKTCHIPKHLTDLYQQSQNAKERDVETNLIYNEAGPSFHGLNDEAHLDISDFLVENGN